MLRRLAQAGLLLALAGALIANSELLASNNLLPRRVAFHLAALFALLLAASRPRRLELDVVPLALLGWSVCLWALSDVRAAGATGMLDAAAALALVFALRRAAISRRRLVALFVGVIALGALLGLIDQWRALPLGSATRPAGLFASRATAGALFAAALPLTALFVRRQPWLASLALVLEAACLVSTRARAAWAAAAVALAVVALFAPALRRRVLLATLAGTALALLLTPGPTLSWRSPQPYRHSLESLARVEVGDRLTIWRETLRLIGARPLGRGPGSFEVDFARHATPEVTPPGLRIESPHNEGLRLALELGLPALALVALLLRGVRRRASPRTWLLRASLLALLVCGLTGKTFEEPPTLVLGCCLVALQLRRRPRAAPGGRAIPLALTAALAGAVVVLDVPQLVASRALARAQAAAREGSPRMAWELAAPRLADNRDLGAWLWAARLLEDAGDASRCTALVEEALKYYRGHPLLLAQQERCGRR